MSFLEIIQGESPLVLGLPHTGTELPEDMTKKLNETGCAKADTDWHIHELYNCLVPDTTTVRTLIHRYTIDVNRDPADVSLYPGQNTTTLCPITDFDGLPIYQDGAEPDAAEIENRRQLYHSPYHEALSAELERVKAIHGFAILYDCHSIRSQIPFLFEGVLPDLNIGTDGGRTCAPSIEALVKHRCHAVKGYSTVLNGRFKGGWTTRHYGRPGDGLHAIQMELAQSTYMLEHPPWSYQEHVAARLRPHLKLVLEDLIRWSPV